ncbi:hypothetical protein PMAYCL1PPCAC_04628 [Pristionchus mayeri]|uniref:Uncharacterized protein n=1 Tax=Pristionchus mayeri TaxID=1317129 RepID=A0AAN4Z508_9BILA|nr:hypothetical protein PMAYCL1PPCAC_04628 [Pristionchus mayeri]
MVKSYYKVSMFSIAEEEILEDLGLLNGLLDPLRHFIREARATLVTSPLGSLSVHLNRVILSLPIIALQLLIELLTVLVEFTLAKNSGLHLEESNIAQVAVEREHKFAA